MTSVTVPSVRPRAVIAATMDDRGRSDCRNSRSSGPWAILRRSSASMRGRKCGIWVQAGSEVTNRSGIEGARRRSRSSTSAALGTPCARTAVRTTRPSFTASIMHMSAASGTINSVTRLNVSVSGSEPSANSLIASSSRSRPALPLHLSRAWAPATAKAPEAAIAARRIA